MPSYNTILGLNERNLRYVNVYNKSEFIRLANNKIASKKLLSQAGILVPETYFIVRKRQDLDYLQEKLPNCTGSMTTKLLLILSRYKLYFP